MMKNITITLDEALARKVRVEAARAGKSMSRWIGEVVEREFSGVHHQRAGVDALLDLPLIPLSEGGRLPPRSEYHTREVFHRHERDRLHPRSKRSGKA